MLPIKEHKIEIDGLTICYNTIGNPTKKPLVFVHGWPMGLVMHKQVSAEPMITELAKYFYVIVPEHPGFVHSEPPQMPWGIKEYADYLHKFITKLEIKKPVAMGKSFGGAIASAYAESHPENVHTLVLADSTTTYRKDLLWYKALRPLAPLVTLITKWVGSPFCPLALKRTIVSRFLSVPKSMIDSKNYRKYLIMSKIFLSYEVNVDYRKLKMPVLLVWGDKDFITPLWTAKKIRNDIKNSELLIFNGGHLVMEKNPKQVISAVVAQLQLKPIRG